MTGSVLGTSLATATALGLHSHHKHWQDKCQVPEIICQNEDHLVWSLDSVRQVYRPTYYLTNPHAQTVFNALFRQPTQTDLRELMHLERTKHTFTNSGATVYLDWITPKKNIHGSPPEKTLFFMPGVVSGTDGVGILNLVQLALERNYRCIVFNYMSKDGLDVMTKEEYPIIPGVTHTISDLSNILRIVENELGEDHPLIGVGISLGANILVQYVGERSSIVSSTAKRENPLFRMVDVDPKPKYFKGEVQNRLSHVKRKNSQYLHPFKAIVAIGNPYDLDVSTDILAKNKLHHYLYDAAFVQKRADMFRTHITMTSTPETATFDQQMLSILPQCKTTRQLDEYVSLPMLHEMMKKANQNLGHMSNLHDFYDVSSSRNWVPFVDVPMLSVSAKDDPISRYECIPISSARFNKNLSFVQTECGGHVGWLDTLLPYTLAGYEESYAERIVMEFIDKVEV